MTTPTGAITLSDVNVELGNSSNAPITLADSLVRALCNKLSGPISLQDLKGRNAVNTSSGPVNGTWPNVTYNFAATDFWGGVPSSCTQVQTATNVYSIRVYFSAPPGLNQNISLSVSGISFKVLSKIDATTWGLDNTGAAFDNGGGVIRTVSLRKNP